MKWFTIKRSQDWTASAYIRALTLAESSWGFEEATCSWLAYEMINIELSLHACCLGGHYPLMAATLDLARLGSILL